MNTTRESRLWHLLGWSFIVGSGAPLLLDILNFMRTRVVDAEALKLGVWCSFTLLAGLAAVVASRIFDVLAHRAGASRWWQAVGFAAMPLGAIMVEWEWQRTMSIPVTLNQKAMVLAGGFIFVAGVVITMGARLVRLLAPRLEQTGEPLPGHTANAADVGGGPALILHRQGYRLPTRLEKLMLTHALADASRGTFYMRMWS